MTPLFPSLGSSNHQTAVSSSLHKQHSRSLRPKELARRTGRSFTGENRSVILTELVDGTGQAGRGRQRTLGMLPPSGGFWESPGSCTGRRRVVSREGLSLGGVPLLPPLTLRVLLDMTSDTATRGYLWVPGAPVVCVIHIAQCLAWFFWRIGNQRGKKPNPGTRQSTVYGFQRPPKRIPGLGGTRHSCWLPNTKAHK